MKFNYVIVIISVCLTFSATSQPLSGKVIDEYLEELPGIHVYDTDTVLLTTTELDGTFELKNPPTELLLGYIGMEWLNISLTNCANPEIIMMADALYHYKSHKKIDRLRKKRFDHRAKIHEQAFEQGVFISEKSCINYEFIPNKPDLDEIRTWMNKKKRLIQEDFRQLNVGDTVFVPYSGASTNSVYSAYSNFTNYNCVVTGIVLEKNKRKRGFYILYKVIDRDIGKYDTFSHNDKNVAIGDTIKYNMKHFHLIRAASKH